LDGELLEDLKRFAKARNEAVYEVIEQAVRRHMANPPPIPVIPPLPPVVAEKPAPAKKPAKSKDK